MQFDTELIVHYQRSAGWLLASCHVNNNRGSSAWYSRYLHPLHGWSHPYPETTGYLIPTLYKYAARQVVYTDEVKTAIPQLMDWLLSLQMADGSFPGGHYVAPNAFYLSTRDYLQRRSHPALPSIFNSAQILMGLVTHYRNTQDARTLQAIERCASYLTGTIRDDGLWGDDAYAKATSPAYFAFATWPLLESWTVLGDDAIKQKAVKSLEQIAANVTPKHFIRKMGFHGSDYAHTHTAAYTLQGILESARILDAEGTDFEQAALNALERVFRNCELHKRLPGGYGLDWEADWRYDCISGTCQFGLCFVRVFEITGDVRYLNAAARLYSNAAAAQRRSGAIPGSSPLRGKYLAWRYPNWAVKFFMDLISQLQTKLTAEWDSVPEEACV